MSNKTKRKARRLAKTQALAQQVRRAERMISDGKYRFPDLQIPAHLPVALAYFANRLERRKRPQKALFREALLAMSEAGPWLPRIAKAELMLQMERSAPPHRERLRGRARRIAKVRLRGIAKEAFLLGNTLSAGIKSFPGLFHDAFAITWLRILYYKATDGRRMSREKTQAILALGRLYAKKIAKAEHAKTGQTPKPAKRGEN